MLRRKFIFVCVSKVHLSIPRFYFIFLMAEVGCSGHFRGCIFHINMFGLKTENFKITGYSTCTHTPIACIRNKF